MGAPTGVDRARDGSGPAAASAAPAGISSTIVPVVASSARGRSPNRSARTLRQSAVSGLALSSAAMAANAISDRLNTDRNRHTIFFNSTQEAGTPGFGDGCTITLRRFLGVFIVPQRRPALSGDRDRLRHGLGLDEIVILVFLGETIDGTRAFVHQLELPARVIAHALQDELDQCRGRKIVRLAQR